MLSQINGDTQRISSIVLEFLKYQKACNHSPRTIQFYREKIARFQRFATVKGILTIPEITPGMVREFVIELQNETHTEGGVHAFFRAIRAMVNWYQVEYDQQGWQNPFDKKVKAPRVSEKLLDPVGDDVVQALINSTKESDFPERDKAIILFLLATGGRAFEVLAVDRHDVDLNDCSAVVRYGKGGYFRFIFYDQKTRIALKNYLKTREDKLKPLWLNRYHRRLKYGGLREIILRLSERAGVDPPTPHAFRRAYAVDKLMANIPDMTVVQLMGQHSINALRPYTKMSKARLQKAYRSSIDE